MPFVPVGVRFERRMLERYGCGSVAPVAGFRRATTLLAFLLTDGVLVSRVCFACGLVATLEASVSGCSSQINLNLKSRMLVQIGRSL